ncbi:hypothetical protein [Streptomyces sp. CA2R106]|uniref:hypothetical protein n=1 Tax=Streptomyces sp. CA2R106 TaxID=3120153 RepID=UPI00300A5E75
MSRRWREPTERGWEQHVPLMNGPVQQNGPAGDYHAGTRPPLTARETPSRRARITAS